VISLGVGAAIAADGPEAKPGAVVLATTVQPIQSNQTVQHGGYLTIPVVTTQPLVVTTAAQVPGVPAPPPIPGGGIPGGGVPGGLGGAGVPATPGIGAAQPMTLWSFLGVPKCSEIKACVHKLKDLLGIPCPQPIGGPDALKSDIPSVGSAAAVKAELAAKPAKIKSIRYLANVENACCYPGVKDALLAALDDCDWEVREEAAKAFGKNCCTDQDVIKRLQKIATERDARGNYKEPYEEVRCAAQRSLEIAMCKCRSTVPVQPQEVPKEVSPAPLEAPAPAGAEKRRWFRRRSEVVALPPKPAIVPNATVSEPDSPEQTAAEESMMLDEPAPLPRPPAAPLVVMQDQDVRVILPIDVDDEPRAIEAATLSASHAMQESIPERNENESAASAFVVDYFKGSVASIDKTAGVAHVTMTDGDFPKSGTRISLFHRYPLRTVHMGSVEVTGLTEQDGKLIMLVRPVGNLSLQQIKKGDKLVLEPK
jgi:hypothetical protein